MSAENTCGSLPEATSATSANISQVIDFACGGRLRKSAEVCGSNALKPAEMLAEVCGTVAEVSPPLKRATSVAALIEAEAPRRFDNWTGATPALAGPGWGIGQQGGLSDG